MNILLQAGCSAVQTLARPVRPMLPGLHKSDRDRRKEERGYMSGYFSLRQRQRQRRLSGFIIVETPLDTISMVSCSSQLDKPRCARKGSARRNRNRVVEVRTHRGRKSILRHREASERAAQIRLEISTDFCDAVEVEFAVKAKRVVVGIL
jgi:hypothetical protein